MKTSKKFYLRHVAPTEECRFLVSRTNVPINDHPLHLRLQNQQDGSTFSIDMSIKEAKQLYTMLERFVMENGNDRCKQCNLPEKMCRCHT